MDKKNLNQRDQSCFCFIDGNREKDVWRVNGNGNRL